jgi:Protein of unknown function (DUF1573)
VKYFIAIITLALLAEACKTKKDPYVNDLGIQPGVIAQLDTLNYTSILFEDSVKDLGTVTTGDTVNIHFNFTNSGDKPLFISSVTPGCGCTIVDYPKGLIAEGEKGVIAAKLNTGTLEGFFHKTIGIVTNTRNGRMHSLTFYGVAKADSTPIKK